MNEVDDDEDLPPADDLYSQLYEQCTSAQLGQIIDDIQGRNDLAKNEILKTGRKLDRVKSIRAGVDKKYISVGEVRHYLFDAEEHGQQHVFFYHPPNPDLVAKLADSAVVKSQLLAANGLKAIQLPRYTRIDFSLQLADFRMALPGAPNDWVVKWYGHERHPHTDSFDQVNLDDGRIQETRIISNSEIKTVMVMRWRHPELLEIRIDRTGSRSPRDIRERLAGVWAGVDAVVSPADVHVW